MSLQKVNLPDIGEGVTEGEMIQWLVKVGDTVEEDQPVAEIMTDKATVEVPSPISGTVKELLVAEGDIVPIETAMLSLETSGATATTKPAAAKAEPVASTQPATVPQTQPNNTQSSMVNGGVNIEPPVAELHVLATPSTRRFARESNTDINKISGTGLAGRVTLDDVKKYSNGAGAVAGGAPTVSIPRNAFSSNQAEQEERVPLRGIRRKIAKQLQMAKQIIPHFTLMDEVNVTELFKMRKQAKAFGEQKGVKVTFLPFVMKALVATMREYPMFNASIDDAAEEIVYKKYFNLGFAADTPNGLVVPVIKNADQKTLLELSAEITELAVKAREGKLTVDDMKGATITITNIGSIGGNYATPIINHPEVAILGMYKIVDKPIYRDGKFRAAKVMNYTITCDHRLIDGAVAANFLKSFMGRIENPSHLMMDMM